jgi:hypothetical protein
MAVVVFLAGSQAYAETPIVQNRVPVVTRLVQTYSNYEHRLAEAINHRDTTEIEKLVAPDFEFRSSNGVGVPVPRAAWIAQSLNEPPVLMSIEQMAVHEHGTARIVSFKLKSPGETARKDITVIDVWTLSEESSSLKTRYAATCSDHPAKLDSEGRPPRFNKRF